MYDANFRVNIAANMERRGADKYPVAFLRETFKELEAASKTTMKITNDTATRRQMINQPFVRRIVRGDFGILESLFEKHMGKAARELMLESSFVSDVVSVRNSSFYIAVRGNVHLGRLDAIDGSMVTASRP